MTDEAKLPNFLKSHAPESKIRDYLLNLSHPDGQTKARFFLSFGFTIEHWRALRVALENHGRINPLSKTEENLFGVKYIVEGILQTPDYRNPHIRTIWFIDSDDDEQIPRLVTAYPLKEMDKND